MPKPRKPRPVKRKSGVKKDQASSVTLADKIADELRERIIDGTFQAGEHLQQAALAKEMGVSSIPFREAIRMLETEGFVEIVPFKGARVRGMAREELVERVHIGFALESCAMELAQPTLTEADFARAADLADKAYPVRDVKTWFGVTHELLGIIYGAARWPRLYDMILRNRMIAKRYTEILVRRAITDRRWAEHWAAGHFPRLVEMLRKGDLEGAKALHYQRLEEYMAQLAPFMEQGAEQEHRRRRALHHVKAVQKKRGRR